MPSASSSEAACGPPLRKHFGDIGEGEVVGARWAAATAVLAGLVFAPGADAQTFFYTEVAKDGRIYVFASSSRYDAFTKSNGADIGPVIERPGYGPNGETVVFDSEDAINLYNFKHGLPGEQFPKPEESRKPEFPSGKFSGLMFGDYYWYYERHQDQISSTDPTVIEGQHGLWFRRIYFTYDFSFNESLTTRFRLEVNSNGDFAGGDLVPYVKDAYLRWTYRGRPAADARHPSDADVRLAGRILGTAPYREDAGRPLSTGFIARLRSHRSTARLPSTVSTTPCSSATSRATAPRRRRARSCDSKLATSGIPDRPRGLLQLRQAAASGNRHTAQGIAGFRTDVARVGAQYLWQERKSGQDDVPDQTIAIWSGFAVWEFLPKKANLFFRVDDVTGHLGDLETGLPGADGIDYWLLSTQSPFTTWIFGGEWYLHPAVRLSPNLELVRYANEPDPTNFPGQTPGLHVPAHVLLDVLTELHERSNQLANSHAAPHVSESQHR